VTLRKERNTALRPRGAWLYIFPILSVHIFTIVAPASIGIYFSFTDWSGIGSATFIGLENYRSLFDSGSYIQALGNNLKWLLFFMTVPFMMALIAAFLLSQVKRGAFIYRLAYFIPYVLPSVIVASLWKFMLNPESGIPLLFSNLGIPGFDKALLGQPTTALWTIAFVDNWHYWGFLATILLVALQSVPAELYEAARIDGANLRQQFRFVTIPGIRPTLVFMWMMTGIWSFLVFDYVWVISQGGPAGSSEVLGTLVYKTAFSEFSAGRAAAAGMTMTLFAGMILATFLTMRKRGWDI
jgi:raffinose/stachyose/melibiose transport system permease protein